LMLGVFRVDNGLSAQWGNYDTIRGRRTNRDQLRASRQGARL
jgi:hypothetical protein